jgi:hypothetical protein
MPWLIDLVSIERENNGRGEDMDMNMDMDMDMAMDGNGMERKSKKASFARCCANTIEEKLLQSHPGYRIHHDD